MADVGCAGIIVADTICGPIPRLPHEGELLAVPPMPMKVGGCAANVAIDLAKQGVDAEVCGCVGNDAAADVLLQVLHAASVGCGQVRRIESHPTSQSIFLIVQGQDRRFLHSFGANAAFEAGQIRREWIDGLKVFYLGGLFAMPALRVDELAETLRYCRERGIATVVDVVVPHGYSGMGELAPLLPHIDYFLPNDDEAGPLTGRADVDEQIDVFLGHGARTVIVTCGAAGAAAASGPRRWRAEAYRCETIDPSGSGDAFAAGVVLGVLRQWDMAQTLRFAAALGASATMAIGTTDGVFDSTQAQAFLTDHPLRVTESTR
ncbi:MAG: carbohydrate kinase family protein [Pirellulales bacterium]|nr:carbohydrate kinase family protein [Pirellulales bacterium]